jgi:hypothetical protein
MRKRTRRNYSPAFKAKVAFAAMKSGKTLAELARQFDGQPLHSTIARGCADEPSQLCAKPIACLDKVIFNVHPAQLIGH